MGCAARKTAESTTCSGSFHGSLCPLNVSVLSHAGFDNCVFTGPGIRMFAMIPSCHTSSAMAWVNLCNAAFEAQ